MQVVTSPTAARGAIDRLRKTGTIAFVPTMGALHDGHLALVRRALSLCRHAVVSIFVNPKQFGPNEDYRTYPRNQKRDCQLLESAGVAVVFVPSVRAMYPSGYATYVNVERLTEHMCGAFRPGHFRGVATIVVKLLNIVRPDVVVFGQKDAQQVAVVRRMVRDLDMPIKVEVVPTIREPDGLAMSSRNRYLSTEQRAQSVVLYRSLQLARELIHSGECDSRRIRLAMRGLIRSQSHGSIEYIEIVDPNQLKPVARIKGRTLIALAVRFGKARLIDNIVVRP